MQWRVEPTTSGNQRAVEVEQHCVGSPALPQDEAVALTHAPKEGGALEERLVYRCAAELVEERGELGEIAGEQEADLSVGELIELAEDATGWGSEYVCRQYM